MIAFVSALLGFVSSAVPDIMKLFRDGRDRAHEITLFKLQMEYDRVKQQMIGTEHEAARSERLEAIGIQARIAEQTALNARVKDSLTGIRWVDALAGSVRPIITYAFFSMYLLVKCAQFYLLVDPQLPWQMRMDFAQAMMVLWSEEDIALFSAVIAFWFGQRTMVKAKRGA
jgi:hypothetical protein